jgi:hypothetical protein
MKQKIDMNELRNLIENGISTEELHQMYDYSEITLMQSLMECSSITKCPTLDLTNVTGMHSMFYKCRNLEEVTLLNTHNVEEAGYAFANCNSLVKINGMDKINDTLILNQCRFMFAECVKLKNIPNFNNNIIVLVKPDFKSAFIGCYNIENINPFNFPDFDFKTLDNKYIKNQYPEYFI